MRITILILLIHLTSCSSKQVLKTDGKCNEYYNFIRNHWTFKGNHLYSLQVLENIEEFEYKNEAYIETSCLRHKNIKTIKELFGEPSKSIMVRNNGTLIYCLDTTCLEDFQAGGKYLWVSYKENLVTKIRLEFFPLIHEEE